MRYGSITLKSAVDTAKNAQGVSKVGFLRRRWLQMLVSGLVLLLLVERTLVATSSPNYVPSVILLGAFLVPLTFTTYLYERLPNWNVSLPALAVCFLWGGVLGTVVAGTLEYDVARALGFLPKLAIGLIEESAKLIVPLGVLLLRALPVGGGGHSVGGSHSGGLRGFGDDGLWVCVIAHLARQPRGPG
jgi:protease PrsW